MIFSILKGNKDSIYFKIIYLALQEIIIEENGKPLAIRSECPGVGGKVFQTAGVSLPPIFREL